MPVFWEKSSIYKESIVLWALFRGIIIVINCVSKEGVLDLEWVELIKRAKMLGLTPEEVREFLVMGNDNA